MVAPYSPTEEDFEEMFEGLPPLNINCERFNRNICYLFEIFAISYFFYVLIKLPLTKSFICD
tara:strand:- start:282 stop:467 length:186 start_codon:yes stop_codon:yes gene_type:complete